MKNTFRFLPQIGAVFFALAVCAALVACSNPAGIPSFTVVFDLNGGSGTPPARQTVEAGSHLTLPGGDGLSNQGLAFAGWNTQAAGTGTTHSAFSVFTPTSDVTLFARWVPAVPVTVSFDVNGGSGTVPALTTNLGLPVQLPGGAGLSRPGFAFDGWNTNQAGTGVNHAAGAAFTPQGDVTLYARWVSAFTVSFNSNGGTGQVPAQSVAQGSSMVIPTATWLSNQGYSFTGWNTMADGIGERFTAGTVFTPTGNITLYATWVPALTFTVTFDVNGAAGGTIPAQTGNLGSSIILPSGESLSNPGFTFSGWNTNAAGTGENFIADASFSSPGDITLFARWVETFTVTFNANGGEGTVPVQQVGQGSGMILPGGEGLSRFGYHFGGWNTSADGAGVNYAPSALFTPNANTTLFARWNSVPTFTITFHANGGDGTAPSPQTVESGSNMMLPGSGGLSMPGHVFGGWNTAANGTGTNFIAGTTFTPTGNVTLFARWNSQVNFTVTFSANGGNGMPPAPQTVAAGSGITLPGGGGLSNLGFTFGGWNTAAAGTGVNFNAGATFTPAASVTLYARWNPAEDVGGNVPGGTLAGQLEWLRSNAVNNYHYVMVIHGNENLTPAQAALPTGMNNLTVSIRGSGAMRTINLASNGNLFLLNDGVTLILEDNVTLNGRTGNHRALVEVSNRGILVMNQGSRIAGNANDSANPATEGGGVRINAGGTFLMHGGEIAGNGSGGNGGGVYNTGTFRVSGGVIHGTDAASGLANTAAGNGAALFNNGTAQRGTFGVAGMFSPMGTLATGNGTVRVANGALQ
jgi:uncharacterized repeat protein (TIGR02543 family)